MASSSAATGGAGVAATPASPTRAGMSPHFRATEPMAYGYRQVHEDLEAGNYCGTYGADHTAYQLVGLAVAVAVRE